MNRPSRACFTFVPCPDEGGSEHMLYCSELDSIREQEWFFLYGETARGLRRPASCLHLHSFILYTHQRWVIGEMKGEAHNRAEAYADLVAPACPSPTRSASIAAC